MKRTMILILIGLFVASLVATQLIIHKTDGTSLEVSLNEIDRITFVESEMVFVEGGTFNPADHYTVTLTSYLISKYEVTQSEWTSVMDGIYNPDWTEYGQGPNHPAYYISWFDAIEYCNRLSIREGLIPCYSYGAFGNDVNDWPADWDTNSENHTIVTCNWEANGYRLPTEMEREFATRGGVPAQNAGTFNNNWAGTDVETELGDYAWYIANAGLDLPGGETHPDYGSHRVGIKHPNELGLYDMSGNVSNWVWDIYGTYLPGVHNNPTGPTFGSTRVLRGGSWYTGASNCAVSYRGHNIASFPGFIAGFRICRSTP